MSAFVKTFDETKPEGSELANTLDTVIQSDKAAINERYELEHRAFDYVATGSTDTTSDVAQGRHIPGNVSATFIGTTAELAALTGMHKGALAYDTTLGKLFIYDGSSWLTYSVGGSLGTAITLSASNMTLVSPLSIGNLANIFDGNNDTYADAFTIPQTAVRDFICDLGSVKRVKVELLLAQTYSMFMYHGGMYENSPTSTVTNYQLTTLSNLNSASYIRSAVSFYAYARYIWFSLHSAEATHDNSVKLAELRVWELA